MLLASFPITKRLIRIMLVLPLLLAGCGVVMEASRPDPVDMKQFVTGEQRSLVVAELGPPTATSHQSDQSCDIYRLYTNGPSTAGRYTLTTTEAVADVLTLGLAEVVTTPVEAITQNSKHSVTMCYDNHQQLITQRVSDMAVVQTGPDVSVVYDD